MNTQEMIRIIDSIARDRNIERDVLISDLETAMVSAARKFFNTLDTEEFTCKVDRVSGAMTLLRHGQPLETPPATFGRIAAQTFKQVMIQKFREDERASLYEDFSKRVGEIVTGVAQRYEGGALVCTVDRAEAFMPRSEQIPGEQFHPGDRIRCLILDVRDVGNQVKIVLSRSHPDFIKRLFEVEVPEVSERVIEIKAMAREAGYRTKIAVSSIDSKVDAVGACVGVRGSRIRNIVDELSGEKIDIVRWNESSQILIQNALKPAEVVETSLCFELGRATVVVDDTQLSLAIGKRGQNVRLAARLTGWDIDILTPEEFNKGLDTLADALKDVPEMTEEKVDRLAALGMISVFDIEEVGAEVLQHELEITPEVALLAVEKAAARAKIVAVEQAKEKEEAEKRKRAEEEAARRLLAGEPPLPSEASDEGDGGEGTSDTPRDLRITAEDDARAAAILSGAEEPAASPPGREHEPDAGYDPGEAESGVALAASDADEVEGAQITENAVRQALDDLPRE